MDRQHVTSGSPWEEKFGYRRAVRLGKLVHVSGTAPVGEDGKTFAPGDAYAQAKRCFQIALNAAKSLGAGPEHVIRTRMYTTDMRFADDIGRAHAEFFHAHPPATTLVEIRRLILPDMLVEIEVEAVLP
jgi:enamine deaminase RidA (YjgF/YER057c/UK114 family)